MALARDFPTNHGPPSVSNNSHHLTGGPYGVGIAQTRRNRVLAVAKPKMELLAKQSETGRHPAWDRGVRIVGALLLTAWQGILLLALARSEHNAA